MEGDDVAVGAHLGLGGGDRHAARALLAGGLGDELLDPQAERRVLGGDDDGHLVATGRASSPMAMPSPAASSRSVLSARSHSSATSYPMSAAGTIPKYESTE